MKDEAEQLIAEIVDNASDVRRSEATGVGCSKPRLLVDDCNPDHTVESLREILAHAGGLYERGVAVRLAIDTTSGFVVAHQLTPDALVMIAHKTCRPYREKRNKLGDIVEVDARLPKHCAVAYCDWHGERRLPPLNGITSAPLLRRDGTIHSKAGYDEQTGLWLENVADVAALVPARPSKREAEGALRMLRKTFATFCFADAPTRRAPENGVSVVDIDRTPRHDESAFLTAVITAVCRPSLDFAPSIVIRAASISGAGTGKGLLVRCICLIAFGCEPHAVTGGGNAPELEKRIAAELIGGGAVFFLDNLNNMTFKSDQLASALTERPARVRILGKSVMVPVNASALTLLTGNGLSVSEDLARRSLSIELDAKTEDPEIRKFDNDIRAEVKRQRRELLVAALTIWRWGVSQGDLPAGRALGSFEQWCRWVRDPLLALGCTDPVERMADLKQRDSRRQNIAEIFQVWSARHGSDPITAYHLHEEVKSLIDPLGKSRQSLASKVEKLAGTRMADFILERHESAGKWSAARYAVRRTA